MATGPCIKGKNKHRGYRIYFYVENRHCGYRMQFNAKEIGTVATECNFEAEK